MKDDERVIAAEAADSPKTPVSTCDSDGSPMGHSDSAPKRRGPAATLRMARYGVEIANGTESALKGKLAAGHSESYARSSASASVTPERALQAAAEVFPSARKTLKALRPKALAVLDRGLDLDKGERPDQTHLQASALALKLGAEIGDDEQDGVTSADYHNARRMVRLVARRFARAALRRAEQVGLVAALDELQAFEAAERDRFPLLVEIDASQPTVPPRFRT